MYFHNKLSRYEAFFLTNAYELWIDPLKINSDYFLYHFELFEFSIEKYFAHWTELSLESKNFEDVWHQAHKYWSNIKPNNNEREEILAIGKFKVIDKRLVKFPCEMSL